MVFSNNKYTFIFVFFLFSVSIIYSQKIEGADISTYYLIRHAEKERNDVKNNNPDLSKKGRQRALNWSKLFDQFKIDAIYSTNYKRTLHTARYIALAKKIDIITYDPFEINYEQFIKDTQGKNVLIVGHSNTIPVFTNKLIRKTVYTEIEDHNNANLYIVTVHNSKISHVLIKMAQY